MNKHDLPHRPDDREMDLAADLCREEEVAEIASPSTYQILADAQNLIRDPKHWTQRTYARTDQGVPVGPTNPLASCWCTVGALIKCGGGASYSNGLNAELTGLFKGEGPVHTNDDKGHEAVMRMLDRVREKATLAQAGDSVPQS
jgi:hypothetical protein